MAELSGLVEVAQHAVGLGEELMHAARPREVRHKGDRDVVTELDLRVEERVREYLERVTPGIGFLGEEGGGASVLDGEVWTLDPIDGTSNFAHGVPLCAVSLALVRAGEPVVAAIVAPFLGLRYYAAKGFGAFGVDGPLRASGTTEVSRAIVSVGDYAVGAGAAEKNVVRLRLSARLAERVERVRMFGTAAIDLAWVAEGRTDATVILSNMPWDTAAGVLLAREAGAVVVDAAGAPHDFTSAETIAITPGLRDAVLELVN
ncbi:inositol monophosphatase family protein [Actinophytocola sp.]|uniref:inositol monophosphatase family protein n=1 Tax=Actinophytocola sp. TaxID=1872138 RepID=UPI002D7F6F39|nr:inositol monophosphatase family protein [Actinophytocola sp.]HET9142264.1 inositol monophosphatase family protein [Actinophytocola sp.]